MTLHYIRHEPILMPRIPIKDEEAIDKKNMFDSHVSTCPHITESIPLFFIAFFENESMHIDVMSHGICE